MALAINLILGCCMIITSFCNPIVVSRKKDFPVLQCWRQTQSSMLFT
jgi:hypothetical protein